MSGHSHFAGIKHKKAAQDAKRAGVFTKVARLVTLAAKEGGGDPVTNFKLRLAIDQARAVNMPKDNIERAIEKGMGTGKGEVVEEIILEGYGPDGVAIVISAVTDNHNRTVSEIKNILEKGGGNLGEPGSVMYLFDKRGEILIEGKVEEALTLELIEMGALDIEKTPEGLFVVYTEPADLTLIAQKTERDPGVLSVEANLIYKEKMRVEVKNPEMVTKLLDILSEHNDVQEVYSNGNW